MIRIPETTEFSINVKLKSGDLFKNKDVTDNPFGDYEKIVSFWEGDKIRVYPLQDVEYYELIPD